MSSTKIFLDNTIQIERIIVPSRRAIIQPHLTAEGTSVISSTYLLMEYRRTVVADFIAVHNLVKSYEQLGAAVAHLSSGRARFSKRMIERRQMILGMAMVDCEDADESLTRVGVLRILELYIEGVLERRFMENITTLTNATDCDLAKYPLIQRADGYYELTTTCNKKRVRCQQHAAGEYQELLEKLAQVTTDLSQARGQRTCWKLGDIIIALEAPPDALIYTTDKDFKTICTALGRKLYQE
ncbi:TPA: hypothetical protein EYP66_24040 [Candidatus Poribacteria bacterium]|nr:hypothetical protein [Candidatus Poribacteria bacterium]